MSPTSRARRDDGWTRLNVDQCPDLSALASVEGALVDLRWVWASRNEYGRDWHVPLTGSASHTLTAGTSGAGKNSHMWCPLVSIAPAIRDGGGASSTATPSPATKPPTSSISQNVQQARRKGHARGTTEEGTG